MGSRDGLCLSQMIKVIQSETERDRSDNVSCFDLAWYNKLGILSLFLAFPF